MGVRKCLNQVWKTLGIKRKTKDPDRHPNAKKLFSWRMIDLGDSGMYCYFDPGSEKIMIFPLTDEEKQGSVVMYGSVSGLERGRGYKQDAQLPLFGLELKDAT